MVVPLVTAFCGVSGQTPYVPLVVTVKIQKWSVSVIGSVGWRVGSPRRPGVGECGGDISTPLPSAKFTADGSCRQAATELPLQPQLGWGLSPSFMY